MQTKSTFRQALSLLPFIIFLILFLGTGVVTGDFYAMPATVAFLIAAIVGLIIDRTHNFEKKLTIFFNGASDHNILYMCFIFILAGAFSSVTGAIGGAESFVKIGLNILPTNLLIFGLFLTSAIVSISMGTSVGTIGALTPIGLSLINTTSTSTPFIAIVLAAIVGGAMFGDNLSFISDTTIAATKTQGCSMRDKFKVNFFIVLPAFIVSSFVLIMLTTNYELSVHVESFTYTDFINVLPYIAVLVLAISGMNVFIILVLGTLLSGIIGFLYGDLTFLSYISNIHFGIGGMLDLVLLTLIVSGTVELIKVNGGLDLIIRTIKQFVKSEKGAQFGIAAIASAVDICTANNTVAIVVSGPVAKEISDEFGVDPRKSASLLDIFSCAWQGIIPYGFQLLFITSLAKDAGLSISPFDIIPYLTYSQLLFVFGSIAILIGFPKLRKQLS
ncbi:Na+/H+ antiporter NhaC family protein [Haloplasma contractile]|uniref:V-type H+-transporting ATPase subunit K protein n=1 Tax=Haloplasma contractile SSD-17B TaxID=1033810 RepID=U2FIX4_9MOLU|nr:Na+/H+ antiporter NhaC family protein [Haloplasma contractile]ERJ12810.1 V-type H+-transporting ATPase subunit K protein [Haloplasma contractile SSD-17B]